MKWWVGLELPVLKFAIVLHLIKFAVMRKGLNMIKRSLAFVVGFPVRLSILCLFILDKTDKYS